jgi:anti-sigma factor RsiW
MNASSQNAWQPDPEQLAAYLDGELEGRDELAPLRARIEQWLTEDAAAQEEACRQRRLREMWRETSPAEPSSAAWKRVWNRIERQALSPSHTWSWTPLLWLSGLAACLVLAWTLRSVPPPSAVKTPVVESAPATDEILTVATSDEIQILRVEGQGYTGALVVGELPLQGPMELLEKDEVTFTSVHPNFRFGRERPMIWAKLESEE